VWTNGEPVVYTNWHPGEPNNASNDDFGRINWNGSNQWDDQPASTTAPYILEFDCPLVTRTAGLASGSNFPVGTTLVTHVATDNWGNTASCSFTVTVVDNINPTISCPSNITQSVAAGSCTATISTTAPTTADNCSVAVLRWVLTGATVANSPLTGINNLGTYTFNIGTTVVTCTATDGAGNTATTTFDVVVTLNETAPTPAPTPTGGSSFSSGGSSGGGFVGNFLTAPALTCPLINTFMQVGANNDSQDVLKLQFASG
jgi:hypothetical protein